MRQVGRILASCALFLLTSPSHAEEQSSVAMHDGCIEEIVALRHYGESVIEMFLPYDTEHVTLPLVRAHVEEVRSRVSVVRAECLPYGDLSRATSALVLLYESYHCIAQGGCFNCVDQEDCDDRQGA